MIAIGALILLLLASAPIAYRVIDPSARKRVVTWTTSGLLLIGIFTQLIKMYSGAVGELATAKEAQNECTGTQGQNAVTDVQGFSKRLEGNMTKLHKDRDEKLRDTIHQATEKTLKNRGMNK